MENLMMCKPIKKRSGNRSGAFRLDGESLECRELLAADAGWGFGFGSSGNALALGSAVDASGNVYVTGYFYNSVDVDPGAGATTLTSQGDSDGFLAKYSANRTLLWAKSFGGTSGFDGGQRVHVDGNEVYLSGVFHSPSATFGPLPALVNSSNSGVAAQNYLAKLDTNGQFLWVRNLFTGGAGDPVSTRQVATDVSGNIYVPGRFYDSVDFDPSAPGGERTSAGDADAFVLKLNSSGQFQWVETISGSLVDYTYDTEVDSSGNVYT
jgi:hypothetical protein